MNRTLNEMHKNWLVFALLLLSPSLVAAVEVEKSPNDDRHYEYLALPNGLKALLVSDPETDKAAAALTVGVGSTSNPPGREGLAHFLEHMLFMGTEKYPEVDEYSDFIKRHGGMDNAFTASNQTTYYFDIKPEALEPALDRFAQFFISPLMDARYVEREKHAVHSEYQLKLKDDDRRIGAAQKQSFNPKSPYARFSVGNLDTLADRPGQPVRKDLLEFYRTHYSADIMGLVVVGREPLPVLRNWVVEKFSAVPKRGAERYRPTPGELIYLPRQLPVKVSVVPLKTLHRLELNFLMPGVKAHYRVRPLYYLSHFIGDEGPGSLFALLRKRGWATSLTASGDILDDEQSYFSVVFELTEEGVRNLDEVVEAFFAYTELLRSKGVESWRFEELKRKKALDFRFKEKGSPSAYAVTLSGKLLDYPPRDLLTAGHLIEGLHAIRFHSLVHQRQGEVLRA
ncbi:MAG TPA: peptidase M16, partial [Chromatiaceae bacterium]|nr:peptidase M16 [Chromatiaceae bacterium]